MLFTMKLEEHQPADKQKPCIECVLSKGFMCLDRRYCRFPKTGKTWKKAKPPLNNVVEDGLAAPCLFLGACHLQKNVGCGENCESYTPTA